MRALIDQLRSTLTAFVHQRDDLLLLLQCAGDESGVVLGVLRDIDRVEPGGVLLAFIDDFTDAYAYADAVVQRLRDQRDALAVVRQSEGEPPPPAVPEELGGGRKPADRLGALMAFGKALLPRSAEPRLSVALLPGRIADRAAWHQLLRELTPRDGLQPWMRGVRIIARTEGEPPPELAAAPRTRRAKFDFSPDAVNASLKRAADDPRLSEAERMQSLLTVTMIDAGHDRTTEVAANAPKLVAYYESTQQPGLQAVVLNAQGEMARRQKRGDEAQKLQEKALDPALANEDPMVLSIVMVSLGDLACDAKRYAEAAEYYEGAAQLREILSDADGKAALLQRSGWCREQAREYPAAKANWEEAMLLGVAFEMPQHIRPNLEHLRRLCQQQNWREDLADVEAELAKCPK